MIDVTKSHSRLGLTYGATQPLSAPTSVFSTQGNPGLTASQVNSPVIPRNLIGGNLTSQFNMNDGYMQSSNFETGLQGWQIDADGNAEFNNGTFRGTFIIGGKLITVNDIDNLAGAITQVSDAGGGTVALVPGTYIATSSYSIPSGVTLDGNGATIDFNGGPYQVNAIGTDAYSTGSLDVNFGSTSVTGNGTTWTPSMVGQNILIGDYWYPIAAVGGATSITLEFDYIGLDVATEPYVIATTVDDVVIKNITLENSSTNLFEFRYVFGLIMDGLICVSGSEGVDGQDSQLVQWLNSGIDTCTAGMVLNNVRLCTFNNSNILNISGGTGLDMTGISNTSIGILALQNITGVGVQITNCYNTAILSFSIIECTSHGIEFVSGNSDVDLTSGYINTCGGDGIKLTATSDRNGFSQITLLNNGAYGMNIANANCNDNILVGINASGNSSGSLNDSGTGTLASTAVNIIP